MDGDITTMMYTFTLYRAKCDPPRGAADLAVVASLITPESDWLVAVSALGVAIGEDLDLCQDDPEILLTSGPALQLACWSSEEEYYLHCSTPPRWPRSPNVVRYG
jgi:hypothetical protein